MGRRSKLRPARLWLPAVLLGAVWLAATARPAAAVPDALKRAAIARVDSARWCADVRLLCGQDSLPGVSPRTHIRSRFIRGEWCALAAEWLQSQLRLAGYAARLDTFLFQFNGESTLCRNVVAEIRGSARPGQVVVLGGHYDSFASGFDPRTLAPGAEDNATGTALVLGAARALAGTQWDRTVRFVLFSAEEQGAYGSRVFAAASAAAGDTLHSAVIADMVTWYRQTPGLILDARTPHAWLAEIAAQAVRDYTTLADSIQLSPLGLVGSDHVALADAGVPAVLLVDRDWHAYPSYHTIQDTWPAIAAKTAQGVATTRAAVAALADLGGLRADGLPVIVRGFAARPSGEAVAVSWETVALPPGTGLDLLRATPGDWSPLNGAPLAPAPGPMVWLDTVAAPAGVRRFYRLELVDARGLRTALAGPVGVDAPAFAGGGAPLSLAVSRDPADGRPRLECGAARPRQVVLRLYDARGRLVRRLWEGWLTPSTTRTFTWDGLDDRRQRAASGLYLVRLAGEGAQAVGRIAAPR